MARGVPSKVDPPITAPNGPSAKDVIVVPASPWEQGPYDYQNK